MILKPGMIICRNSIFFYLVSEDKYGIYFYHLQTKFNVPQILYEDKLLTSIFCEDFFDEHGNKL